MCLHHKICPYYELKMCVKLWLGGCDVLGSCRSPALLWGFGILSVRGWLVKVTEHLLV